MKQSVIGRLASALLVIYLTSVSSPIAVAFTEGTIPVQPNVPAEGTTPVELELEDTALVLTGCASPNAFVTIFEDNNPVGTVIAGADGRFEKKIVADGPGLMNVKAYFDDVNGRTSSTITQNISLAAHQNTVLNVMLPTTIEHEPEPVVVGEFLIFRGTACPFALVNVTLDNNFTLAAKADERGNWYIIADTSNFFVGQHTYHALSSVGSLISDKTEKYQVKVLDPSSGRGDSQEDPLLTPPEILDPQDGYLTSTPDVVVSGIGPTNTQIEIIVDGKVVGSVFTNAIGEWSFKLFMSANQHVVQARSCRDGKCSDLSNSVRVYYNGDFGLCSITFELDKYRFFGMRENDGIDLDLLFRSGTPEYDVLIDWGDAVVEHITLYRADPIKLHHVYSGLGQYNGIITIRDSENCTHTQYFSVDVSNRNQFDAWWLLLLPALLAGAWAIYMALTFRERRRVSRRARAQKRNRRSAGLPPIRHFPSTPFSTRETKRSEGTGRYSRRDR